MDRGDYHGALPRAEGLLNVDAHTWAVPDTMAWGYERTAERPRPRLWRDWRSEGSVVSYSVRGAVPSDAPLLGRLIAESARGLAGGDYTSAQIEASIGTSWAVDTQL